VENLENFIFVEAHKIESVREAITGLAFCYFKIDILPIEEMTKIYEDNDSKLVRPKKGQWVRIRGGLYQDDLGQVDYIQSDERIFIKLVPRVNPKRSKDVSSFMRTAQMPYVES
jgi:hypothetical protein